MVAGRVLNVTTLFMLGGCTYLTTNAGHPDSYQYTTYYQDLRKLAWNTTLKRLSSTAPTSQTASPVFIITRTPQEIWQARAVAWNKSLQYEAASYKAQDVQNNLAIPVFGAAIAVAATAISHASTVAIAGTGIGGAAAGAGYTYLHPDKDATADRAADSALLCVVNQAKILTDMSAVPLVLDKAALQDALSQLSSLSGPLSRDTSAATQAARTAVKSAQNAGEAAIKSLNTTIAQYVQLPADIYQEIDQIDGTAKSAGARIIDYASLVKTLQASATNQAATDTAKSDVQASKESTAAATSGNGGTVPPAASTVLSPSSAPASTPDLTATAQQVQTSVSNAPVPEVAAPDEQSPPPNAAVTPAVGKPSTDDGQAKSAALTGVFNDPTMSAVDRVNQLATTALDDIPDPNFSAIAGNIKACDLQK
jgi:hypothetical protein